VGLRFESSHQRDKCESKFRTSEFDFRAWIGRRANASAFTLDNSSYQPNQGT